MGRKKLNLSEEERILRKQEQMRKVYERRKLAKKNRVENLTPEQAERNRERNRVANLTPEQLERKRERNRISNLTPEQVERNRERNRIANLTPEQLERKRQRNRVKKLNALVKLEGNLNQELQKYQCEMCDYKTGRRYMLARHMTTHSDARPFKCSFCERCFKTSALHRSHMRIHFESKKPFQCTDCVKCFKSRAELNLHRLRRHTENKPYKCSECNYSCAVPQNLKHHMGVHTGERPYKLKKYQCPHCPRAYAHRGSLMRHLTIHGSNSGFIQGTPATLMQDEITIASKKIKIEETDFDINSCENSSYAHEEDESREHASGQEEAISHIIVKEETLTEVQIFDIAIPPDSMLIKQDPEPEPDITEFMSIKMEDS